jgi:flagellar biosynthetic protein FliP
MEVVIIMTVTIGYGPSRRAERHNLIRHFVEMVLAMLVGMAVLGMVAGLICAALGHSGFLTHHAGLRAWVMALNMTIGMAVWMRYRGHSWGAITEMGGAMFVPVAVLIVPYLAGAISAAALLVGMHVLMFPAMVVAMLHRRDEYEQDHRRDRPVNRTRSAV